MSGPRKHDGDLAALEQRIGYAFKDRNLLREALTHGSALDGGKKKRDTVFARLVRAWMCSLTATKCASMVSPMRSRSSARDCRDSSRAT